MIEAGCKARIGQRCKQSGMFWSRREPEHILAQRCIHYRHRIDLFWKARRNQLAARTDSLAFGAW